MFKRISDFCFFTLNTEAVGPFVSIIRSESSRQGVGIRTRNRLGTTGVGDVDELVKKSRMLIVVPVAKNDGELLVIRVHLLRRVNDYGCAKTVDVLTLNIE